MTSTSHNVAIICQSLYGKIGGVQVFTHNLAINLSSHAYVPIVFSRHAPPPGFNPGYRCIKIPRIISSRFVLSKLRIIPLIWFIYQFKRYSIKIIQLNGGFPFAGVITNASDQISVPCILRTIGKDIVHVASKDYGDAAQASQVRSKYKLFDHCIALTNSVRLLYLQIPIPEEKISVIGNGVNIDLFDEKSMRVRAESTKQAPTLKLITVGRNIPIKGYDRLRDIIKVLSSSNRQFEWSLIGDGTKEYEKLSSSNVKIVSHEGYDSAHTDSFDMPHPEIIKKLISSDIYFSLSYSETFGLSILEGFAAGLFCIGFDAPGVNETIQLADHMIITPSSLQDIPIGLFSADISLKARLRRRNAASTYQWSSIASRYANLYTSLLSR